MEGSTLETRAQAMTEVNTFRCFEKDRDNDLSNYLEKNEFTFIIFSAFYEYMSNL